MEKFNIYPYIGVGSIKFGDARSNVRTLFGDYKEYKKSKFSRNTTDDFGTFHVFYDTNDCVEAIEFYKGSKIYFLDTELIGQKIDFIQELINGNLSISEDNVYHSSVDGIILSVENNTINSVFVYCKDYWK